MTGPHDGTPGEVPEDLTDPDERRVRDLLADLGSGGAHAPGPVPADVAARLDAALDPALDAALDAGPAASGTPASSGADATVTPLQGRRPRRRAGLLAAAAAVVVLVGGGALVLGRGDPLGGAGGSSQSSADSSGSSRSDAGSEAGSDGGSTGGSSEQPEAARGGVPDLGADTLRRDVRRLVDADRSTLRGAGPDTGLDQTGCAAPDRPGRARAVTLDGTPAVLLVRTLPDGTTAAQVWSCEGDRVLAGTRFRAAAPRP
ncbi:hypothetical protein SAMN04488570_2930 [Nocardioides scoriae]|uniref:Uncharacterized protein n=1 Tax=Nocardioides scoriae TaxID=642780 RepID=A0A1H1VT01_9ACTN|nr:hypothetical protein [Nocardioides scoriae]SDS87893.1 hypothetical protein SAMN04488570_2930 [Nocardioides scoriae]